MKTFIRAITVLALAASVTSSRADEIVIQGSTPNSRITLTGEILDYTGKKLTLKTAANKPEQTYAASDIVSVKTDFNDAHQAGLNALSSGDLNAAEAAFDRAAGQEVRVWVRRELLALQTRCALRSADWVLAAQRFSRLYQSDPETQHIDLVPLFWSPRPPVDAALRGQATVWLREKQSLLQLIGGSWLCFEPKYDGECEQLWPTLIRNPDERLRTLAQWQSYRRRLAVEGIGDIELQRWETRIPKLDAPLRAGPYFLLGQAFVARHEFDLAAGAFLRLPLAHPTDHALTAEALLNAARCLNKSGLRSEAETLFKEVTTKFAHTTVAREAEMSLRSR